MAWYSSDDAEQLEQHLSNGNLLSFTQKYAHLLCMNYQLEMKQDYWKHVIDELLPAIKWLSWMPKNVIKQYSINWNGPRTEHNVQHRQNSMENKFHRISQQIQVHLQQYSSCRPISDKTMDMLKDAVKEMVELDLEDLQIKFEEKKVLLQYDANDMDLLKFFFDIKPTKDQVVFIRCYFFFVSSISILERQCKQNLAKNLLNNEQGVTSMIFDLPMRTIIENRQQNIANRTQQIISVENAPHRVLSFNYSYSFFFF